MKPILKTSEVLEKKTMTNLNLSIFYHENMWYKVLNEAIWSFIDHTHDLKAYSLMLCHQRGDHIKLILKTDKNKARSLAQKADMHLRKFLKKHPSASAKSLVPKQGPYMDFKNNSVHYGIFDYLVGRGPITIFEAYQQNLTDVLLEVFQCYGPDTLNDLVEIMIQLFTVFCNAAHVDKQEAIALFDFILELEYKKFKDEALMEIIKVNKANFEDNKGPILEYLSNNRKDATYRYNEKWQNTWSRAVNSCRKSLSKTIARDKMKDEYVFMINSLCNAFDFKDSISAYYLFSNALKNSSY